MNEGQVIRQRRGRKPSFVREVPFEVLRYACAGMGRFWRGFLAPDSPFAQHPEERLQGRSDTTTGV